MTTDPLDAFDPYCSKMVWDPSDTWQRYRCERPVAHSDRYGGFYMLSTYEDVYGAFTDPGTFSSAQGISLIGVPGMPRLIPPEVDPPQHRQYRDLLSPAFTPKAVAPFEPRLRTLAADMLDKVLVTDELCIVETLCRPFPRLVALEILGFPLADEPRLSGWIEAILARDEATDAAGEAGKAMMGYLMEFIAAERAKPAAETIPSAVVHGVVNGEPISDHDALMTFVTLLFGGLHTTTTALSGMFLWLGGHPEDVERLKADPALMSPAVEEFVRYTSPTSYPSRVTADDTEVRGCPIPKGSRVVLAVGAANRDPDKFVRPEEALIDRSPNHHLGFGMGPHRCVGSHLAKLEMRVVLEEFLERVASFRIDHGGVRWGGGVLRSLERVPVVITERKPSPRSANQG